MAPNGREGCPHPQPRLRRVSPPLPHGERGRPLVLRRLGGEGAIAMTMNTNHRIARPVINHRVAQQGQIDPPACWRMALASPVYGASFRSSGVDPRAMGRLGEGTTRWHNRQRRMNAPIDGPRPVYGPWACPRSRRACPQDRPSGPGHRTDLSRFGLASPVYGASFRSSGVDPRAMGR